MLVVIFATNAIPFLSCRSWSCKAPRWSRVFTEKSTTRLKMFACNSSKQTCNALLQKTFLWPQKEKKREKNETHQPAHGPNAVFFCELQRWNPLVHNFILASSLFFAPDKSVGKKWRVQLQTAGRLQMVKTTLPPTNPRVWERIEKGPLDSRDGDCFLEKKTACQSLRK